MLHRVITPNDTLTQLISLTNQTALAGLARALDYIGQTKAGYNRKAIKFSDAALSVASVGARVCRAAHEVGMTLPVELRVRGETP